MKNIEQREIDVELTELLDELSYSYSMIRTSQQSLEDLDKSIEELGMLVEFLKEQSDKQASH